MKIPTEKYFGDLEQVHAFYGEMPTGVSVSETGRMFINFPEWGMLFKQRLLRSLMES